MGETGLIVPELLPKEVENIFVEATNRLIFSIFQRTIQRTIKLYNLTQMGNIASMSLAHQLF